MKKYSPEFFELKKNILNKYVQPFLDAIKKGNFSTEEVIKETMRRFQIELFPLISREKGGYLNELQNSSSYASSWKFLNNKDMRQTYINLGRFYFASENNQPELTILNQTIVRELLLDQLPQLAKFTPKKIETMITSTDQQKDFLPQIYYTLTKPIKITTTSIFGNDPKLNLRDSISDRELLGAVETKKTHTSKLFKSIYDAVEYAQFKQRGGDFLDDDKIGYMPAVMLVTYIGDSSALQFEDEILTIHPRHRSSVYGDNERQTHVAFAKVAAKNLLPLSVVSLHEAANFGGFHIFNHLNLNKLEDSLIDRIKLLVKKSENLASRDFKEESKKLQQFTDFLQKQLKELKININQHPNLHEKLITDFKSACTNSYEKINKDLENHRGVNHIIMEVFFSVLTCGIYFVAMGINKLSTGKYSFFSTDSTNQLKKINQNVIEYSTEFEQKLS